MSSKRKVHVMIDLETLGTKQNSPILTIGAIVFDPKSDFIGERFYNKINMADYNNYQKDFQVDYETLQWWNCQTQTARDEAFSGINSFSLKTTMKYFDAWLSDVASGGILIPWANGKEFDLPILEHTFTVCDISVPWKFWDTRDTRTVYDLFNINLKNIPMPKEFEAHNPVGDCLKQIKGVQMALKKLGKV